MDAKTKATIKRLMYIRKKLENIIDNEITETVLRNREVDMNAFRESLIYHLDDNLMRFQQEMQMCEHNRNNGPSKQ